MSRRSCIQFAPLSQWVFSRQQPHDPLQSKLGFSLASSPPGVIQGSIDTELIRTYQACIEPEHKIIIKKINAFPHKRGSIRFGGVRFGDD